MPKCIDNEVPGYYWDQDFPAIDCSVCKESLYEDYIEEYVKENNSLPRLCRKCYNSERLVMLELDLLRYEEGTLARTFLQERINELKEELDES